MTIFLVLNDEQTEIMTFGLAVALQRQRQLLAGIMQERLLRAANGEDDVDEWKKCRFNGLISRVSQLQALISMLDTASVAPDSGSPD